MEAARYVAPEPASVRIARRLRQARRLFGSLSLLLSTTLLAQPLVSSGGRISDAISSPGEVDVHTFTAIEGQSVHVRAVSTQAGGITPHVRLRRVGGPDLAIGASAVVAAVACPSATCARLQAGDYEVLVRDGTAGGGDTGTYDVHFALLPGAREHGPLASSVPARDRIDAGDIDTFTFTARGGESVHLRVADLAQSTLAPAIHLYGPDGSRLAADFSGTVASIICPNAVCERLAPGEYTVLIEDATPSHAQDGDYQLQFALIPGDVTEGSVINAVDSGGRIEIGDVDTFHFEANEGQSLLVRVTEDADSSLAPHLFLYGPSGEALGAATSGRVADISCPSASCQHLAAGTYTIAIADVTSGQSQTGDYTLRVAAIPGASEGVLNRAGDLVDGRIDVGDIDTYTFTATVGDSVQIEAARTGTDEGLAPHLRLFDPDGVLIAGATSGTSASVRCETGAACAALRDGTYTIVVSDATSGRAQPGNYRLRLSTVPAPQIIWLDFGTDAIGEFGIRRLLSPLSLERRLCTDQLILVDALGSTPAAVVPPETRDGVSHGVQQLLVANDLDVPVVTVEPNDLSNVVRFFFVDFPRLLPCGDGFGKAYDVAHLSGMKVDRFNLRKDGKVLIARTSVASTDPGALAEDIVHEFGHAIGLRHVNPRTDAIEIMDYQDAGLSARFTRTPVPIVEPPVDGEEACRITHNPYYHMLGFGLNRPTGGLQPGDWEDKSLLVYELRLLEPPLGLTFSDVLFGTRIDNCVASSAHGSADAFAEVHAALPDFPESPTSAVTSFTSEGEVVSWLFSSDDNDVLDVFAGTGTASDPVWGFPITGGGQRDGRLFRVDRNSGAVTDIGAVSVTARLYQVVSGDSTDDADGDGLNDAFEAALGTDPEAIDSDVDGITDADEVGHDSDARAYTVEADLDPLQADSDGDGLTDGDEVAAAGNPRDASDGPGLRRLDIDGDGTVDALTDGLLVLRSLFAFSGNALTDGVVGSGCTRCSVDAIAAELQLRRDHLDIDGDGDRTALTDGVLLLRHLFGFTGSALTDGAIGTTATRRDAVRIRSWLAALSAR